jgi:drug/metabolite transporter (DMT)-like permease
MMTVSSSKRPFGVTILAILAGVLAVLAGIHTLQALGILPFAIGPFSIRAFSFFNALMWGLMVWVYIWLIQMLWRMDPQAWLFLAVITVFNLILDFVMMLSGSTWSDVSISFLINALILIYVMLPGTRRAFGQP